MSNVLPLQVVKSPSFAAACVLGVAFIAAAAFQVGARAGTAAAPPAPVSMAMVDIPKLFNNLQENADRNDLVIVKGKGYENELKGLAAQITQKDNELKTVIPPSDKRRILKANAEIYELETTIEARKKIYQRTLDLDKGEISNEVYPKVTDAIKRFAAREGFDLILFDDRSTPLPEIGTFRDYNEQIVRKRILFAKDGLDVTEQILTMMNNEYAAVKKLPPP